MPVSASDELHTLPCCARMTKWQTCSPYDTEGRAVCASDPHRIRGQQSGHRGDLHLGPWSGSHHVQLTQPPRLRLARPCERCRDASASRGSGCGSRCSSSCRSPSWPRPWTPTREPTPPSNRGGTGADQYRARAHRRHRPSAGGADRPRRRTGRTRGRVGDGGKGLQRGGVHPRGHHDDHHDTTPPAEEPIRSPLSAQSESTPTAAPTTAPGPPSTVVAPAEDGPGEPLGRFSITCYSLRGTTASGAPVAEDGIAVDPRVIPLGSRVYVDGLGLEDRPRHRIGDQGKRHRHLEPVHPVLPQLGPPDPRGLAGLSSSLQPTRFRTAAAGL